jgi:two-component system response regulator HydG
MTASQKPSILVVDDDSGHRITLKTVLKSWGYRVSEAKDGQSAVTHVHNTAFDLILMDVRMAVMDGFEALQKT